jgi:ubiquinone/menaquinone biosynthesis C-methylase UbiE
LKQPEFSQNKWTNEQEEYWGNVAQEYRILYADTWSGLEDHSTKTQFESHIQKREKLFILDLACGQGFGFKLVQSINSSNIIDYTGVDISSEMIAQAIKDTGAKYHISKMCDLSLFTNNSFDIVSSFNSSLSYSYNIQTTIDEVYRVLKNDGYAFLSLLNRYSLRRLISLKFNKLEKYNTRGITNDESPLVHTYSLKEIQLIFSKNFEIIDIYGLSLLGGVMEYEFLWKFDQKISAINPQLCHIFNIVVKKK